LIAFEIFYEIKNSVYSFGQKDYTLFCGLYL